MAHNKFPEMANYIAEKYKNFVIYLEKYSLEIFKMLGNPRQEYLNGLFPGIPGITLGTLFILFIGNRIGTITADGTPAHLPW